MKRLIAISAITLILLACTPVSTIDTQADSTAAEKEIHVIATTITTEPTEPVPTPEELLLSSMTLEEKVGQLFLARCPEINALEDIQKYHLGGYILFSKDFDNADPHQIIQTIQNYQLVSKTPMLIAVDEEGGSVCRISSNPAFRETRFQSPRKLFDKGGIEAIKQEEEEKCSLLNLLGININMAPVCDISTEKSAFMYDRSLGQDALTTSQFVSETVSIMDSYRVGSVLKHFPGYGNNTDTHTGIAVDNRALEELQNNDLLPFSAGIQAGCDAILVSHTIVNAMDNSLPASLSPAVHEYMRKNMLFAGVIITDDLDMRAITKQFGVEEAAVFAVLAGNDLICTGNYARQHNAIMDAVLSGRISLDQIDNSVLRILQWKSKLGLMEPVFD